MLPYLRSKNSTSVYNITSFGGLCTSHAHRTNELTMSVNTSSENYPALCSAKTAASCRSLGHKGLGGGYFNRLYTLEHTDGESGSIYLCHDTKETEIATFSSREELDKPRKMGFIKNEILVIPDNIVYNTNSAETKKGCVTREMTSAIAQQKFEAESKSDDPMPMKYNTWYSAYLSGNSIVSMHSSYRPSSTSYQFYNFSLTTDFEIGDVVTVKMTVKPIDEERDDAYKAYVKKMAAGVSLKIKDLVKTSHSTPSGTVTEYTEVVFEDGTLDHGGYDEVFVLSITVEKGIPNFVDICSLDNRMWGVTAESIHASKLGDSAQWQDFTADGYGVLPSSSYETGVESDGSFTAITAYNGSIIAFKENCIHKVYGSEPKEFTVSRKDFPGVAEGARDTLAIVAGVLYYKGKNGVYAYTGNVPKLISDNVIPQNAICTHAGGDERFYYIDCTDGEETSIYVYDTLKGVWHMRSGIQNIKGLTGTPDGVKIITADEVLDINSQSYGEWAFELGFGEKEFASKNICSVYFRYTLGKDSGFDLYLKNKHDTYKLTSAREEAENNVIRLRLPVSCDRSHRLHFAGNGYFALNSIDIGFRETGIYD